MFNFYLITFCFLRHCRRKVMFVSSWLWFWSPPPPEGNTCSLVAKYSTMFSIVSNCEVVNCGFMSEPWWQLYFQVVHPLFWTQYLGKDLEGMSSNLKGPGLLLWPPLTHKGILFLSVLHHCHSLLKSRWTKLLKQSITLKMGPGSQPVQQKVAAAMVVNLPAAEWSHSADRPCLNPLLFEPELFGAFSTAEATSGCSSCGASFRFMRLFHSDEEQDGQKTLLMFIDSPTQVLYESTLNQSRSHYYQLSVIISDDDDAVQW